MIPDRLVKMDEFGMHVSRDLDVTLALVEQDIEPARKRFDEDLGIGDQFDDPPGQKRFASIPFQNRPDLGRDIIGHTYTIL